MGQLLAIIELRQLAAENFELTKKDGKLCQVSAQSFIFSLALILAEIFQLQCRLKF